MDSSLTPRSKTNPSDGGQHNPCGGKHSPGRTAAGIEITPLENVLADILCNLQALIPSDSASIYLQAGDRLELVAGRGFPESARIAGLGLPNDSPLYQEIKRTGKAIILPDVQVDPRWVKVTGTEYIHGWMGIPLMVGDQVMGLFSADSRQIGIYDQASADLAQAFANQAAVSIENARLNEALEHRLLELQALNRTGQMFTSTLDQEEVLALVLDEVRSLLSAESASILLYDPVLDSLVFAAAVGPNAAALMGVDMPAQAGVAGWVLSQGQPVLVPDAQQDSRFYSEIDNQTGLFTRSLLVVPMRYKDRVTGVIEAVNRTSGAFTQADLDLLLPLANNAAIAIENARLYQELQKELAERERAEADARRQAARAEALAHLASRLAAEMNLQAIYEAVCEETAWALGTPTAAIGQFYPDEEKFECIAAHGVPPSDLHRLAPLFNLFTEDVLHGRGPVIAIHDLLAASGPQREIQVSRQTVRSIAFASLVQDGQVAGALAVVTYQGPRDYTRDEKILLQAIADQANVAITRAGMFTQIRTAQERLAALSRRLVEVQELERRRLALELHDEIGQQLTGLKLILGVAATNPSETTGNLARAQDLLDELMDRIHNLSLDLRPTMLDDLGLLPSLAWYFKHYEGQTQIGVHFEHGGLDRRFAPTLETTVYRIIQEALTNVARHAGTAAVEVRVWTDPDTMHILVEDRGVGFEPQAAFESGAPGLAGMVERASQIDGTVEITSAPGAGASVSASIPIVPQGSSQ